MQSRHRILTLMSPPTLWLVVLFVLPLGLMALFSVRAGSFAPERDSFSLDAYRTFLAKPEFARLLGRSAVMAFQTSIITVVLSYPLAYFLSFRAGQWRAALLTLLIIPAWTSFLLRVLAWKVILGSNGALATFLLSIGVIQEAAPILLYSRTAVVVTLVYSWIPFVMLPIFSALERIDRRLLEAATDLGCAPWEAFLRVTLPLSLPGIIAGFFFVFIPTLGEWVTPTLVGGAQGTMYGNLIQDQFVRALNWPLGSLMSLVMLVVVVALAFLLTRFARLSDLAGA
jgi:spermidine/putrescine transport system permease protein